jgi:hypothetical protein
LKKFFWTYATGDFSKLTLLNSTGFIPRRLLELSLKGSRSMGRSRRRWFSQAMGGGELERNPETKD